MAAYDIGDKVFGEWEITDLLGEGSYGKVWRIERREFGVTYEAALKVISVPASAAERKAARSAGLTDKYFYSVVENFIREIALMDSLKGISSIVSYEDHKVIEHEDGAGWDILIRMELLTPLTEYLDGRELGQMEVIRLGIQLCEALEECAKRDILHRDIKPENIFVTKSGDFKLGDFGVARTLSQTKGALSQKGTAGYMAPEVYRGDPYGRAADIYSLGVVLYQLMNQNRLPFYPLPPEDVTFAAMEKAMERRLQGDALPAPFLSHGKLTGIILKAAAFRPEDRYGTPGEMKNDLLAAYNSTASLYGAPARPEPAPEPETKPEPAPEPKAEPEPAPEPKAEPEPAPEPEAKPEPAPAPRETGKPPEGKPKGGKALFAVIAVALAAAVIAAAVLMNGGGRGAAVKETAEPTDTEEPAETEKPAETEEPTEAPAEIPAAGKQTTGWHPSWSAGAAAPTEEVVVTDEPAPDGNEETPSGDGETGDGTVPEENLPEQSDDPAGTDPGEVPAEGSGETPDEGSGEIPDEGSGETPAEGSDGTSGDAAVMKDEDESVGGAVPFSAEGNGSEGEPSAPTEVLPSQPGPAVPDEQGDGGDG